CRRKSHSAPLCCWRTRLQLWTSLPVGRQHRGMCCHRMGSRPRGGDDPSVVTSMRSNALAISALALLAFGLPPEARTQTTMRIVVGYGEGGGFDASARILARHIGKYLPGRPTVIVQNMPGAGGLKAATYIAEVARTDSSVIAIFSQQLVLSQLVGASP